MSIWSGAFTPPGIDVIQKSIGSVEYVPLHRMSPWHWELLDWSGSLRNSAKNKILDAAAREQIVGFIHFKYIQKGTREGGYLYPVLSSEVDSLDYSGPPWEHTMDEPASEQTSSIESAIQQVMDAALFVGIAPALKFLTEPRGAIVEDRIKKYLRDITESNSSSYQDLDAVLTFVFTVLSQVSISWLQDWADEVESALGAAEDAGLL